MKFYQIEGFSLGRSINIKRRFISKTDALNYVFGLLPEGTEIQDSYANSNDDRVMNYKCNNHTAFTIRKL